MKFLSILILFSLFFQFAALAQKGEAEIKVFLRDGSVFNGTVKSTPIEVTTKYGKLQIPFADISEITLGIIPDAKNKTKIEFQLNELQNENETTRQNAYDELIKISINELYIVEEFVYSEKYQPGEIFTFTAESLFSELKQQFNISEGITSSDLISFGEAFQIGGTTTLQNFDLKTTYGALSIPRTKIEKIQVIYVPGESDNNSRNIILQANKHISGNAAGGWLNTGIQVKKGQKIQISANGQIILASLSNAKYGPNGPVSTTYNEGVSTYTQYGQLVYKIGDTGTMINAGAKYNGIAQQTGTLFLSIYETVYNQANTGSYTVVLKIF